MKTRTWTHTISSITLTALLAAAPAFAHSGHDHSHLPVDWTFDSKVQAKITKNLINDQRFVGLSVLEQKTLDTYGIQVGQSFNTRIGHTLMKLVRTSGGLRIEGGMDTLQSRPLMELPLAQSESALSPVAYRPAHSGHDHRHLDLAWVFDRGIESKIRGNASGIVGLNKTEQKVMERYGIRVGNRFRAYVDDQTIIVERTSLGLKILSREVSQPVASVPTAPVSN